MDYEEILRAYRRALAAGEDRAALEAEVRRLTGFTPAQLARRAERRSPITDRERALLQGLTFGFADEIAGAVAGAIPGGRDYTQARDNSRARLERVREEQPKAALAAEIVGGALVPAAGAVGVGGRVLAATGSRVLASGAGGLVAGAGAGAVQGAGDAEERGDIPRSVVRGAAVGGTAGAVLGAGASALGRVSGRIGGMFGRESVRSSDAARHTLTTELARINHTPGSAVAATRALGPGAVVADLSPSLARAGRAARNMAPSLDTPNGPAQRLRDRTGATRDRVAGRIRQASGLTQGYDEATQAAERGLEDVRAAHYGPIEQNHPIVTGQNVIDALQDPDVARVATLARIPEGAMAVPFRPLQDTLIWLRRAMQAPETAELPGAGERARRAYDQLRQAMVEDIPGFGEAQTHYEAGIRRIEALAEGRKMANRPPDEARRTMEELSDVGHGLPAAEQTALQQQVRDAFRQGMLDGVEVPLGTKQGTAGGAMNFVQAGPTTEARLRLIARDDPSYRQLMDQLRNQEARFAETGNYLGGNSTTSMQLADGDKMLGGLASPPTDAQGALSRLWDWGVNTPSGVDQEAAANMIGHVLMSEGREAAAMLAHRMRLQPVLGGVFGTIAGGAANAGIDRQQ